MEKSANCWQKCLIWMNVDSLEDLEVGPDAARDSRILMKQLEQMKGVTKCASVTLLLLSVAYLITRVIALIQLKTYRRQNQMLGNMAYMYSNIQLIHVFTVVHSATCVGIALFVFFMLKKNTVIDRR